MKRGPEPVVAVWSGTLTEYVMSVCPGGLNVWSWARTTFDKSDRQKPIERLYALIIFPEILLRIPSGKILEN